MGWVRTPSFPLASFLFSDESLSQRAGLPKALAQHILMLNHARHRSATNDRLPKSVARTVTTQCQRTGRMPYRLDLQERAQSGRARRCCKVRNALGNVYPLDRLGCGLLEGLTQVSIRTGEIEGIDIRVSREVRSKLRDPS